MLFQIRQAFKARRGIKIHYWQAKLVIIITILFLLLNIADMYQFNFITGKSRLIYLLFALIITGISITCGWLQIRNKIRLLENNVILYRDGGYFWIILVLVLAYFLFPALDELHDSIYTNVLEIIVGGLVLGRFLCCYYKIFQNKCKSCQVEK